MSQSDDLEAIDRYFNQHASDPGAQNSSARADVASWRTWYGGLGFWDKNVADATMPEARRRRDEFNAHMGQPDLIAQGFKPADLQPQMTKADVQKEFAGGGKAPVIKKGSRGTTVKKWQTALGITADGNFGPNTEKATKAFQSAHGITPDGIVGPVSWAAVGVKTVSDIHPPPPGFSVTPRDDSAPAPAPAPGFKQPVVKDVPLVFRPDRKSPAFAPTPKAARAPAPMVPVKPQVKLAGMFENIPTWGKVAIGAGVLGAIHYAIKQREEER